MRRDVAMLRALARADRARADVLDAEASALESDDEDEPPDQAKDRTLLDRAGLGRALNVSVATIDRLARSGLPFDRVGEVRRFDLVAVRAWLASRPDHKGGPNLRAIRGGG